MSNNLNSGFLYNYPNSLVVNPKLIFRCRIPFKFINKSRFYSCYLLFSECGFVAMVVVVVVEEEAVELEEELSSS